VLEGCNKYPFWPTRRQTIQVGFPHAQRQSAEVFAVERENVEGVELHRRMVLRFPATN
jgi:hypothetical protein